MRFSQRLFSLAVLGTLLSCGSAAEPQSRVDAAANAAAIAAANAPASDLIHVDLGGGNMLSCNTDRDCAAQGRPGRCDRAWRVCRR